MWILNIERHDERVSDKERKEKSEIIFINEKENKMNKWVQREKV